ncbi:MAG: hypothetical protein ACJ76S_11130 [Solirubrobacteraceae bacterium]|jgi:hypothetical protein
MPTEPPVPTVFEVMRRAADVCDPGDEHPAIAELLARFEDRDEPITALDDPEAELAEAAALDEELAGPAEVMALALATYLAHRRDEIDDHREELLRLAARAEFGDDLPAGVRDWLAAEGVQP